MQACATVACSVHSTQSTVHSTQYTVQSIIRETTNIRKARNYKLKLVLWKNNTIQF